MSRIHAITSVTGFSQGSLPFTYLGIQMFKGKPKALHLRPVVDRIQVKLNAWKGRLLTIMGRVQLVNAVISSMLTYSFHVYKWPVSLLSEIARSMRNFIWSGVSSQQKMCTVAWRKVCQPKNCGGLAVRDPATVNKAALLLLAWKLLTSEEQWATVCRDRFLHNHKPKTHHITSSVWHGMKSHIQYILDHASWSVGNGQKISFWTDKWLDTSIAERWHIPPALFPHIELRVAECLNNRKWCLPAYIAQKDPALADKIHRITLSEVELPDQLNWTMATDGHLTNKLAYSCFAGQHQSVPWASWLWNSHIPPTRAFITWRLIHNKIPTDENLRKRGCHIVSICCFCLQNAESSNHIFFECRVTTRLWEWLGKGADVPLDHTNCCSLLMGINGRGSKLVQQVLTSAIIHTIWAIWIERNQRYFHDKARTVNSLFNGILAEVKLSHSLVLAKGNSNMLDYKVARLFNIPFQTKKVDIRQEVKWCPPPSNVIKINFDGSAIGSHPCGAVGIVLRDSNASFLGAIASNIGPASALEAEFSACMLAIEKAKELHLTNICLESDSLIVVKAFQTNSRVPWRMRARWINCMVFCNSIICSCVQVFREGNQVADAFAKNGQSLALFSSQWWLAPPSFARPLLDRDTLGLSFFRIAIV